jgi:hypothetical protein
MRRFALQGDVYPYTKPTCCRDHDIENEVSPTSLNDDSVFDLLLEQYPAPKDIALTFVGDSTMHALHLFFSRLLLKNTRDSKSAYEVIKGSKDAPIMQHRWLGERPCGLQALNESSAIRGDVGLSPLLPLVVHARNRVSKRSLFLQYWRLDSLLARHSAMEEK